jgi:hypothetical protein
MGESRTMSGAQRTHRPSTRIQLSPKQANIYTWRWQKDARFRYAVCGEAIMVNRATSVSSRRSRQKLRLLPEQNGERG